MTEYALRLESGADTAPRVRMGDALALQHAGSLGARSGLRPDGGGVVTVVAGTMDVQVTPFLAWIDGTGSAAQAGYPFVCDATKTLTLADGHATLSRTDVIAAVVRDDTYDGSGTTAATLEVVQGTPGAGAPALPASAVPLRNVTVPAGLSAGTGGLASGNLSTDRRVWTAAAGGIVKVASATERDAMGAIAGQVVYRADTGGVQVYDGTTWETFKQDDGLRIERGTVTCSIVAAGGDTESVAFSEAFSGVPTVTVASSNNSYYATVPIPPTTTGADVRIVHRDGSNTTANVDLYWIAIGPA